MEVKTLGCANLIVTTGLVCVPSMTNSSPDGMPPHPRLPIVGGLILAPRVNVSPWSVNVEPLVWICEVPLHGAVQSVPGKSRQGTTFNCVIACLGLELVICAESQARLSCVTPMGGSLTVSVAVEQTRLQELASMSN